MKKFYSVEELEKNGNKDNFQDYSRIEQFTNFQDAISYVIKKIKNENNESGGYSIISSCYKYSETGTPFEMQETIEFLGFYPTVNHIKNCL